VVIIFKVEKRKLVEEFYQRRRRRGKRGARRFRN